MNVPYHHTVEWWIKRSPDWASPRKTRPAEVYASFPFSPDLLLHTACPAKMLLRPSLFLRRGVQALCKIAARRDEKKKTRGLTACCWQGFRASPRECKFFNRFCLAFFFQFWRSTVFFKVQIFNIQSRVHGASIGITLIQPPVKALEIYSILNRMRNHL